MENLDLPGTVRMQEPALHELTPEGLPRMNNAEETSQDYTGVTSKTSGRHHTVSVYIL